MSFYRIHPVPRSFYFRARKDASGFLPWKTRLGASLSATLVLGSYFTWLIVDYIRKYIRKRGNERVFLANVSLLPPGYSAIAGVLLSLDSTENSRSIELQSGEIKIYVVKSCYQERMNSREITSKNR